MPKLSVNIDHIATLREARKAKEPDPLSAALLVELAGAQGITVHLRRDRRHIHDRDLNLLKRNLKIKLNLEMAASPEMVKTALALKPDLVTLVPEEEGELTTQGGLALVKNKGNLRRVTKALQDKGIPVSLFVNPEISQVKMARKIGAKFVELHTGIYAKVFGQKNEEKELARIKKAAQEAKKLGLEVNAGHDLTYQNVTKIAVIKEIGELSIGHNIIARALLIGLDRAVKEMIELINN
jgi:pyridoxine 5-phosphate synthase